MNYSYEEKKKIYQSLPMDIQEAITSVDSGEAIDDIAKKYSLHIDQIAELGGETGDVLLGISDPMDFVENVSNKLKVDKKMASQIVGDINEKIFVNIKDSLRQIHSQAPIVKSAPVPTSNLIKSVPMEEIKVPQKTLEILKGNIPVSEKKPTTDMLGFSMEKKNISPAIPAPTGQTEGHLNIMEEKMKGSFSMPKTENGQNKQSTVVDPYREMI